jgi:hypothetical protein
MDAKQLDLYAKLQPFILKRMGSILPTDELYEYKGDFRHGEYHDIQTLLIPKTIDDSSPEASKRSLWGMVDWERLANPPNNDNHKYIEGHVYFGKLNIWMGGYNETGSLSPTEAILKALCVQEGIEI